jgi:cobalt-zinc-cadmium efflux system protein
MTKDNMPDRDESHADHSHHDHGSHGHSHAHHAPQSFNMAFGTAVALNLAFVIFEVFYAMSANSMSLLADAAHNFGDVCGLVLAWGANWLMNLPARKRYSYGYKRTTILAALANALILVSTSMLIAFEAINKLWHMSMVNEKVVVITALVGIVVNGGTALLFMKGAEEDLNIKGAFLHLLMDALIAFGVVVAGIIVYYTGKLWLDPVVALLIVITILWSTWGLLRDSLRLMLDGTPHHIDVNAVNQFLLGLPDVTAVHDLHIWGLSTKEAALTAHLVIESHHAANVDYKHINQVLKDKFKIGHATLQVEMENSDFLCLRSDSC